MVRVLLLFVTIMFLTPFVDDADAKRFGGGRSFGSKSTYSKPASKPSSTEQQTMTQRDGVTQQNAAQARPGGPAARPGFGGMLGGLLMGGLIGSMLFGGGFGGINLIDILLIGGGLFLLTKVLRSRRAAVEPVPQSAGGGPARSDAWAHLQGTGSGPQATNSQSSSVPEGFDQDDFLEGAKAMYNRMQQSWAERDLDDIAGFVTPELMGEVRRQAEEDDDRHPAGVLLVKARLLEVRQEEGRSVASVYFDVLMHEDPTRQQPSQVQEIWHFIRNESVPGDSWRLDGIQQLEQ
ncbi:MAG: Tim44 domain-containing protein [Desulfovibrionales bacterium]